MRIEQMQTPYGVVDVSFSYNGDSSDGFGLNGASRFDSADIDEAVDRMLMAWPKIRNDQAASVAFARGLEYMFAKVEEIEFAELRATDFIPVTTEVTAGSLTFTYTMLQKVGSAAVISNMAGDLPLVSLTGKQFPKPVITIGVGYSFGFVEVQRAERLNIPLESMLAAAAKWAIEFLLEQIACTGFLPAGVVGMTNAPGVSGTTQVSTGTWLAQIRVIGAATPTAPWAQIAAVQGILTDINKMKSTIRIQTEGLYAMDTVLFPLDLYCALEAVPASPFTTDTIIDYIEKLCHVTLDFWPQLNTASATGHGRVMAYKKDPGVLSLVMPRPFTQFAPQAKGLAWIVPCIAETGGVMVKRPLAMTWMDGLDDTP